MVISASGDGKPKAKFAVAGAEVLYLFEPKGDPTAQEVAAMIPFC